MKIETTDGTANSTTFSNSESGEKLDMISSAVVTFEPHQMIQADITAYVKEVDVKFSEVRRYQVIDPNTAEAKDVTRIEFADGSVWTALDGGKCVVK